MQLGQICRLETLIFFIIKSNLKTLHATQYQNREAVVKTFLGNDQRNFWNKQLWVMESLDRVDKITKIDNFDWSIYYSLNFTYWITIGSEYYWSIPFTHNGLSIYSYLTCNSRPYAYDMLMMYWLIWHVLCQEVKYIEIFSWNWTLWLIFIQFSLFSYLFYGHRVSFLRFS